MYNNISLKTNLVVVTRTSDAVQNRCWQTGFIMNRSRVQGYRRCSSQEKAEGIAKVDFPYATTYWTV